MLTDLMFTMHRPGPDEVLGVDPEADREVVKRAYREIAKACHPDVTDDRWRHRLFNLARDAYEQYQDWWAEEDTPPEIVSFLRDRPGSTKTELRKYFAPWQIRRAKGKGWIENRGESHRHAWYATEPVEAQDGRN